MDWVGYGWGNVGFWPLVSKNRASMNTHGKYIYSVRCAPIAIERKRYGYSLPWDGWSSLRHVKQKCGLNLQKI